jgi:hypothetical protein
MLHAARTSVHHGAHAPDAGAPSSQGYAIWLAIP